MFGLATAGREKVVVGGKRIVPAPDDVGKVRTGRFRIVPHLLDTAFQTFHHAGGKRVANLKVHLRGKRHLTRDFRDTAGTETGFREIFSALQTDTAAGIKVCLVTLDINVVRRALVHGNVDGVLRVVLVHRSQVFLLGKRVVFVRHADIPEDIPVTGFRYEVSTGKLRVVVIRPDGDDLELAGVTVEVHLEIVGAVLFLAKAGKFAPFLEGYAFHLAGKFVGVGIEVQRVIPEIPDHERVAVLIRHLRAAYRGHGTHATGIDIRKGVLLVVVVDAVLFRVHIHIFGTVRKL